MDDIYEIQSLILDFNINLFLDDGVYEPFCLRGSFPRREESSLEAFGVAITDTNIKKTMLSIGGFKDPGEDGY